MKKILIVLLIIGVLIASVACSDSKNVESSLEDENDIKLYMEDPEIVIDTKDRTNHSIYNGDTINFIGQLNITIKLNGLFENNLRDFIITNPDVEIDEFQWQSFEDQDCTKIYMSINNGHKIESFQVTLKKGFINNHNQHLKEDIILTFKDLEHKEVNENNQNNVENQVVVPIVKVYKGSDIYEEVEGSGEVIEYAGDTHVVMEFSCPLNEAYVKELISFNPSLNNEINKHIQIMNNVSKGKGTIYIELLDEFTAKQLELRLRNGRINDLGHSTDKDVIVNLERYDRAEGSIRLVMNDGTLGEPDSFWLTTEPKTFEISFTKEVDRESVERAILGNEIYTMIDSIDSSEGIEVNFQWVNDKTLRLHLSNLAQGFHFINTQSSLDKDGVPVSENVNYRFNASKKQSLLEVNTVTEYTKEIQISRLKDERLGADGILSNSNMLMLKRYDVPHEFLSYSPLWIDLDTKKEYLNEDLKLWTDSLIWVDDATFIYRDEILNIDGSKLGSMSLEDQRIGIKAISISPDKTKIAAFVGNTVVGSKDLKLHIYNLDGNLVQEIPIDFKHKTADGFLIAPNLTWINNKAIISEGWDEYGAKVDLYRIDMQSKSVETFIENASEPVYLSEDNFIAVTRMIEGGSYEIQDKEGNKKTIKNFDRSHIEIVDLNGNAIDTMDFVSPYIHNKGKLIYIEYNDETSENIIRFLDIRQDETKEIVLESYSQLEIVGISNGRLYLLDKSEFYP